MVLCWSYVIAFVTITVTNALLPHGQSIGERLPDGLKGYEPLLWDIRHFLAFFAIGALSYRAMRETPRAWQMKSWTFSIILGCGFLAASTEIAQALVPEHVTSLWDFLVDMSGASIGILGVSMMTDWTRRSPDPRIAAMSAAVFMAIAGILLIYYLLAGQTPPS